MSSGQLSQVRNHLSIIIIYHIFVFIMLLGKSSLEICFLKSGFNSPNVKILVEKLKEPRERKVDRCQRNIKTR